MSDIDFNTITACGEYCVVCNKKSSGLCEGCIESGGHCKEWKESKGCPVAKCAKQHNVQFCGVCKEFPCQLMVTKITWNKNIIEQQNKLAELYWQQKSNINKQD